ncbi:MAG: transposase [Thermoplasmatota archaeon]
MKRAAFLTGLARRTTYYKPRARLPPPVDGAVREVVVQVCTERPSFGYRRVTAMVRRRMQMPINHKQIRRIMRQENLLLKQPRRPPRQRIPKEPGTLTMATPDEVWHMDVMYVLTHKDGYVLAHNIVDACTSEWVGFLFDKRYRKEECIRVLEEAALARLPETGRAPGTRLRLDNHFSQTCDDFVEAAKRLGFQPELFHKHQPEMNGVVESFHSILRKDYVDLVDLQTEREARDFLNGARLDYNHVKPKQRLGWKTPNEFYKAVTQNATLF